MPKFQVEKGHDAWIRYSTIVEATSAEEAETIASIRHDELEWTESGKSEFDDWQIMNGDTELVPETEWPPAYGQLATEEGWGIFEAEGSVLNKNGNRPYQLQKVDEARKFEDDSEAWDHVYHTARAGSALHRKALDFLREHSHPEFEVIIYHFSPDGKELNKEFKW